MLSRIGEPCAKHHVTVLSDEIHCDLTAPGKEYVPFASGSEVLAESFAKGAAGTGNREENEGAVSIRTARWKGTGLCSEG